MKVALADTGPLYALVDPDDAHHPRSRAELERLTAEGRAVVVAVRILMESFSLVLPRLGVEVAHRWLGEVERGTARIEPLPEDLAAAGD